MSDDFEIDVLLSPAESGDTQLRDRQVVVVDVLRATTVIAHALANGAEQIIPAGSVEEALEFKAQLDRDVALLCGEREGRRISGFDLGNSPLEYDRATVGGRSLVLASTNGTVVLSRCGGAVRTLTASFCNLSAVARAMRQTGGPWFIACSGKLGRACLEDLVCAGRLARLALGADVSLDAAVSGHHRAAESGVERQDGLGIALALEAAYGTDLRELFRHCAHGRYLEAIGFGPDLDVCAAQDSVPILPEYRAGRIFRSDLPPDGLAR